MGCLYEAVNTATGKRYLGVTTGLLEHRKRQHERSSNRGCHYAFYNSMRKHGPEKFVWNALLYADEKEYLYDIERRYIEAVLESGEKLYNTAPGGKGGSVKGRIHSQQAKTRLRGEDHHRFGTKQSEDTINKRSGINSALAVLNEDIVREIKYEFLSGKTLAQLSRDFEVGTSTIHRVTNNHAWKDVPWPIAYG